MPRSRGSGGGARRAQKRIEQRAERQRSTGIKQDDAFTANVSVITVRSRQRDEGHRAVGIRVAALPCGWFIRHAIHVLTVS